jgi:hypothetical protein
MIRKLYRICLIAVMWTVAWGISGAAIGAIVTVFHSDTGHIPSEQIPILIGVPSAAFGLAAGLLYGALAVAFGAEVSLGTKGRTILGAGVGCVAGIVFMRVLAHSYLTILVAVLLGILLARSSYLGKVQRPKSHIEPSRGT